MQEKSKQTHGVIKEEAHDEFLDPVAMLIPLLETGLIVDGIDSSPEMLAERDIITMESKLVEVDFLNQYTVSYLKYEKWHNGKLVQTELQRFPLRWYGVEEFRLILERAGFSDIVVSADYVYGRQPSGANRRSLLKPAVCNSSIQESPIPMENDYNK